MLVGRNDLFFVQQARDECKGQTNFSYNPMNTSNVCLRAHAHLLSAAFIGNETIYCAFQENTG